MYRVTLTILFAAVLITAAAVFAIKKDAERAAEWMRFTEREAQRQAAEERLAAATAGRDRTSE